MTRMMLRGSSLMAVAVLVVALLARGTAGYYNPHYHVEEGVEDVATTTTTTTDTETQGRREAAEDVSPSLLELYVNVLAGPHSPGLAHTHGPAPQPPAAKKTGQRVEDFRFLEDRTRARAHAKARAAGKAKAKNPGGTQGNFPEQEWTYKDLHNPPAWLVPPAMQAPGLPLTKPPPVPQMVPPPPPFPPTLDNKGPYAGEGQDYSPPPPTYSMPRPPPAALPRWVPWSAYYVPDEGQQ